ncbi:MAG: orotidine-5'-phosphate decarboxylase [Desulfobacteraceae bacterium]|nr:orotidine-5'-phosphate decarboxylase [Desulfobacteraceae bacterium]
MGKRGKDYIVFPLDFASVDDAKKYVALLKDKVGMFKVGLELFIDQGPSVVQMVKDLSGAKVFLDLKLHDISATVGRAMERVAATGADLVTVHCSSSMLMLQQAVKGGGKKTGVLGVTLLTDNDANVVEAAGFKKQFIASTERLVMKRAQMAFDAGCKGIVCSGKEVKKVKEAFGKDFLAVTPGIRPSWTLLENDDQKRVTTPQKAVTLGSDYIVIGRPIRDAKDPVKACDRVIEEIEAGIP